MKIGTEDRKKLIVAASLGVFALGYLIYTFAGGSDTSGPAPPAPVAAVGTRTPSPVATRVPRSALDPTLHPEGMELTEQLVYTGNGRNIFSVNSEPVKAPVIEKVIGPVRPPVITTTPANLGPPPPPPIDLRFFATATRKDGSRQAFFLKGEDVFAAMPGDIVNRRYKVGTISANSAEVTDLTNNNTQRLPLEQ